MNMPKPNKETKGMKKSLMILLWRKNLLRGIMSDLGDKIESDFFSGVEKINEEFRKFFVSVFGGGKAGVDFDKNNKKKNKEEEFSDLQGLSASLRDHAGMETDATDGNKEEETGVEISISHPKREFLHWKCYREGKDLWWRFLCFCHVSS